MKLIKFFDDWQKFYSEWCNQKKIKVIFRWLKINFSRLIPKNSEEEIDNLYKQLIVDSSWKTDFILCTIVSCLIASFGLLSNSTAVIIGAMLVAPLMLPLRGLAFSACEGDFKLFRRAAFAIVGATILSLFLSSFIAKISAFSELGSEIIARTRPNLIDLGIAVTAGAMSGFGKIRTGISDTLAGTAIAVALMPPLCVVGICLTMGNYPFATGAFLLYFTNLLGITLACMIVFIFSGYTKPNHALGWTSLLTSSLLTFLLVIPLGASFFRLIEQQEIETEVKNRLIYETFTIGQDVEGVDIKVVWTTERPTIYVTLETDKEISPKQVQLTEKYINDRLNRDFQLILFVSPLTRITGEEPQLTPEEKLPEINPRNIRKDSLDFLPESAPPQ